VGDELAVSIKVSIYLELIQEHISHIQISGEICSQDRFPEIRYQDRLRSHAIKISDFVWLIFVLEFCHVGYRGNILSVLVRHIPAISKLHTTVPCMPPKSTSATPVIPLTSDEKKLLEIAVRLDSAVRYWEKHMDLVKKLWLEQGFEEELVCVLL
jgi:hypothetical protein